MNATESNGWKRTSPLAAVFYLGRVVEAIAKNAVQSLAPLAAFLVTYQGDLLDKLLLAGGAFALIIVGAAVLRYLFFRYRITGDSILIREGVIKKTQVDIKFDRVQAINTQQNVIYRAFGLVTVQFDTAGSSKQEGHLPAVSTGLADSLKEKIRRRAPIEQAGDDDEVLAEPPARPILELGARDMLRIGLSSNRALVLLVLLGPVIEWATADVEENIDEAVIAASIEASGFSVASGVGLGFAIFAGFLLLLSIASIGGAFLRYHGFRLLAQDNVLRSVGGLLTRHEQSLSYAKVQSLVAKRNPPLRFFGKSRISAKQASSGRPGQDKHFLIPLAGPATIPDITGAVFRGEFPGADLNPHNPDFQRISPRYVRSRVLITGILPALAISALFAPLLGIGALFFFAGVPIAWLLVRNRYRKYGFLVTADGMLLRRGFLGFQVTAFVHRKVQRVSVTQTPFQARKGLATLKIYLASGTLKMPWVDAEFAQQLRDYQLFKVESSELAWH